MTLRVSAFPAVEYRRSRMMVSPSPVSPSPYPRDSPSIPRTYGRDVERDVPLRRVAVSGRRHAVLSGARSQTDDGGISEWTLEDLLRGVPRAWSSGVCLGSGSGLVRGACDALCWRGNGSEWMSLGLERRPKRGCDSLIISVPHGGRDDTIDGVSRSYDASD
jgi:hypothetical protein